MNEAIDLTREECERLLRSGVGGRVALCSPNGPYIVPVNHSVVDDAMQVMGGVSVAGDHRIQRIWRDLRVDRISGGTDEMMILTVAKGVLRAYAN